MKKEAVLFFVFLFGLFSFRASANEPNTSPGYPQINLKIKEMNEVFKKRIFEDPSVPIKIKKGKKFTIKLKSNPSTGYAWHWAECLDSTGLSMLKSEYDADKPILAGSGGHHFWHFKPIKAGTYYIKLRYSRSESGKEDPIVFTVEVE